MKAHVRKGYAFNPDAPIRFVRVENLGSFETTPDDTLLRGLVFDEYGWGAIEIERDVFLARLKIGDEKLEEHFRRERAISDRQLASMDRQSDEE